MKRFLNDGSYLVASPGTMLLFKPGTTRPYASVPVTANRWPRLTPGRVCVNTKYEADNCILELADFRKGGEVQKWLPFAELQVSVEHVKVSDRGGQVIWLERKSGCIGLFDVDAKKRKTFQPKVEPDDQVEDIAISPDGALLAWGTRRTLCLMDTRSGKEIRKDTLKGDMGTEAIEFTPDAKTLIAFCWRRRHRQGSRPSEGPIAYVPTPRTMYHSPHALFADSRRAAMADDKGVIRIFDLQTGMQLDGHSAFPRFLGLAMIEEHTAVAWADTGLMVRWDIRTGQVLSEATITPSGKAHRPYSEMRFSPDGRLVAAKGAVTANKRAVPAVVLAVDNNPRDEDPVHIVGETSTGKSIMEIAGKINAPIPAVWHPSGKRLAVLRLPEAEEEPCHFDIHELTTARRAQSIPVAPGTIRFVGDGRTLLHAAPNRVALLEIASGQPRWTRPLSNADDDPLACEVSLDAKRRHAVVVRGHQRIFGEALLFDLDTGDIKANLFLNTVSPHGWTLSASGRWLAAATGPDEVEIHDLESANPNEPVLKLKCGDTPISALALNANSTRLITAHEDGTCLVWPLDLPHDVPLREDGQLVAALAGTRAADVAPSHPGPDVRTAANGQAPGTKADPGARH